MPLEAWFVLFVIMATLFILATSRIAPDAVLLSALALLIFSGVLPVNDAFAGFANQGLLTVAVLYAVTAGLVDTGVMDLIGTRMLGRARSVTMAILRVMLPTAAMSAFLNNTPVVAMLLPAIQRWSQRHGMSESKLLLPLSYAAILGGTCTLIGTSTNLVVNGLMQAHGHMQLGLFSLAWVGIPFTLVGIGYMVVAHRWLLPARKPPLSYADNSRDYLIEMLVQPDSPVVGKSIEAAGLRSLPGAFVAEIKRGERIIPAVAPEEILYAGDLLLFAGNIESVADLIKLKGLLPAPEQVLKLNTPRPDRVILEAVISNTSPVVWHSVREGGFRTRYGAVILAVARDGRRMPGKVGDLILKPGDCLLLEASPAFLDRLRNSRDFLALNPIDDAQPLRHEKAPLALLVLALMVMAAAFSIVSLLEAALAAALLMVACRCTRVSSARSAIDWSVLIVIGASLGIGAAFDISGAAQAVAGSWLAVVEDDPMLTLAAIYLLTLLLTEVITNNAAAVIVFPVAEVAARQMDVSIIPFAVVIMVAASASFATPIGYQTNLIVYGPGGYRFSDYLRIGIPLSLLTATVTLLIVPNVWPF